MDFIKPKFEHDVLFIAWGGHSYPTNPYMFADKATAEWLQNRFNAKEVRDVFVAYNFTRPNRCLVFEINGTEIVLVAGLLAAWYENVVTENDLEVADKRVRDEIAKNFRQAGVDIA